MGLFTFDFYELQNGATDRSITLLLVKISLHLICIPLPFCSKQCKPSTLTKPFEFCIWNEMDTLVENVLPWNPTDFKSVKSNAFLT